MKKPWVAVVLSLFCSGLGHLYCGRLARAAFFFFAPFAITLAIVWITTLAPSGSLLALVFALVLLGPILYVCAVIDAPRIARTTPVDPEPRWWQHAFVYALVLVVGLVYPLLSAAFLRAEVLGAYEIPTMSMAPTILRGDRVLVTKWAWEPEDVRRGDILIFLAPDGTNRAFVKRVQGLPGDRVEVRDGTEQAVPSGHVWMRGDNVVNSGDSRHFGAVPFANLVGRVAYRYWPPSRVGTLADGMPDASGAGWSAARSPQLQTARLAANETAAIATLRNIVSAQAHFQASARVDQDSDGTGEFGGFLELSGAVAGRMSSPLVPPALSGVFRELNESGEVSRSGYLFKMFLPGPADANGDAAGVPEPVPNGYANDVGATLDADLAETTWCCYAWPVDYRQSGVRTFFTNQTGVILGCDVGAYSGTARGPEADAAFDSPGCITGRVDAEGPGRNPGGQRWRPAD